MQGRGGGLKGMGERDMTLRRRKRNVNYKCDSGSVRLCVREKTRKWERTRESARLRKGEKEREKKKDR